MDLRPTPEQVEIIDSSAAFLRDRFPISTTRALFDAPSNVDAEAWAAAAELGWFALGLPESTGASAADSPTRRLLFREIGRSLATGPFLSTVLAARVAAFGGSPALAEEISCGQRVALAVPLTDDRFDGAQVTGPLQMLDPVDAGLVLVTSPTGRRADRHGGRSATSSLVPGFDDGDPLGAGAGDVGEPDCCDRRRDPMQSSVEARCWPRRC